KVCHRFWKWQLSNFLSKFRYEVGSFIEIILANLETLFQTLSQGNSGIEIQDFQPENKIVFRLNHLRLSHNQVVSGNVQIINIQNAGVKTSLCKIRGKFA